MRNITGTILAVSLLVALAGLARHWPREHRAARVIQRARKSTETAVQAAATESQS